MDPQFSSPTESADTLWQWRHDRVGRDFYRKVSQLGGHSSRIPRTYRPAVGSYGGSRSREPVGRLDSDLLVGRHSQQPRRTCDCIIIIDPYQKYSKMLQTKHAASNGSVRTNNLPGSPNRVGHRWIGVRSTLERREAPFRREMAWHWPNPWVPPRWIWTGSNGIPPALSFPITITNIRANMSWRHRIVAGSRWTLVETHRGNGFAMNWGHGIMLPKKCWNATSGNASPTFLRWW